MEHLPSSYIARHGTWGQSSDSIPLGDLNANSFPDFPLVDSMPPELLMNSLSGFPMGIYPAHSGLPMQMPLNQSDPAVHLPPQQTPQLSNAYVPRAPPVSLASAKIYNPPEHVPPPVAPSSYIYPSSRFYHFLVPGSEISSLPQTPPMAIWSVVTHKMVGCNDGFMALFELRFPYHPPASVRWDSFGYPPPSNLDEETAADLRESMDSLRTLMGEVASGRAEFARGDFLVCTAAAHVKLVNITILLLGAELVWLCQEPRGMGFTVASADAAAYRPVSSLIAPAPSSSISPSPPPLPLGAPPPHTPAISAAASAAAVAAAAAASMNMTTMPASSSASSAAASASAANSMPPPPNGERRSSFTRAMPPRAPQISDEDLLTVRRVRLLLFPACGLNTHAALS